MRERLSSTDISKNHCCLYYRWGQIAGGQSVWPLHFLLRKWQSGLQEYWGDFCCLLIEKGDGWLWGWCSWRLVGEHCRAVTFTQVDHPHMNKTQGAPTLKAGRGQGFFGSEPRDAWNIDQLRQKTCLAWWPCSTFQQTQGCAETLALTGNALRWGLHSTPPRLLWTSHAKLYLPDLPITIGQEISNHLSWTVSQSRGNVFNYPLLRKSGVERAVITQEWEYRKHLFKMIYNIKKNIDRSGWTEEKKKLK